MLFVTFHGGKPEKSPHKNNVHAYDKDGKLLTPSVLDDTGGVLLDELRGICSFRGFLYVVNANKTQNSLLCYQGSGTNYRFVGSFASRDTCKGILHPFNVAFDGLGFCYLSSQDTNVVTRLTVAEDGKTGAAAAVAPALVGHKTMLPGTFVASSIGDLGGSATTPVPEPLGLQYSSAGAKQHSVRGVVWMNDALYVADQPAGRVKVYDSTGKFLGQSNQVESPVHLLAQDGTLYVTGGDDVLVAKLAKPAGDFTLSAVKAFQIKNCGGMAIGDSGNLYIASRTENRIYKFDAHFNPLKFGGDLPDNPEFLLHV